MKRKIERYCEQQQHCTLEQYSALCYCFISYTEIDSLLSHIAVCLVVLISVGIVRFERGPFQTVVVRIERTNQDLQ